MNKQEMLKNVFIFNGLDEALLKRVASLLEEERFNAGAVVFDEGKRADALYIVDSGEIVISKRLGQSGEKTLTVLMRRSVFGEMAFFADSPRTAKAAARTDSVLWKIGRSAFMDFIEQEPRAGIGILSGMLQITMNRLEHTSRELATVYETGKAIAAGSPLRETASTVTEKIMLAVTDCENCALYLYNEFNEEYEPLSAPEGSPELPKGHPAVEKIAANAAGMIYGRPEEIDFSADRIFAGARSLLTAPLIKEGRTLGFLAAWNCSRENAFKNSHAFLLSAVAGQLAEAVENIRRRQEDSDLARLRKFKAT